MNQIGGVDGCPGGWLCIERTIGGRISAEIFRSTAELVDRAAKLDYLAIDIPIGLGDTGPRSVDKVARQLLGKRRNSVFPAPVRGALDGQSYEDACRRSFAACAKKLSKQTYAILPRVRAIDEALRANVDLQGRVREVHPELCFYHLNAERPMDYYKKLPEGGLERRQLLECHFGRVLDALRAVLQRKDAQDDDILDALVALWTAERLSAGTAVVYPDRPEFDRFGLRMEMVA